MHATVLPPSDSQRGAAQLEAARRSRNPTPEATALQLSAGRGRGAAGTRRPRPRRSNCRPVEAALSELPRTSLGAAIALLSTHPDAPRSPEPLPSEMCCSSPPPPEPRRHAEMDAAARHELLLWPLTCLAPARCALLRRPLLRLALLRPRLSWPLPRLILPEPRADAAAALPRPCSWSRDRRRARSRPRHDNLRDAVEEHRAPRRPPPSSLPLSYALSLFIDDSPLDEELRTTAGTAQHQGQYRVPGHVAPTNGDWPPCSRVPPAKDSISSSHL